jgi:hypothetical protein
MSKAFSLWVIIGALGVVASLAIAIATGNLFLPFLYSCVHIGAFALLCGWFFSGIISNDVRLFDSLLLPFVAMHLLYFGMSSCTYYDTSPLMGEFELSLTARALGQASVLPQLLFFVWLARCVKNRSVMLDVILDKLTSVLPVTLMVVIPIVEVYLYANGYRNYDSEAKNYWNFDSYWDLVVLFSRPLLWRLLIFSSAIVMMRRNSAAPSLALLTVGCLSLVSMLITKERMSTLMLILIGMFVYQAYQSKKAVALISWTMFCISFLSPLLSIVPLLIVGRDAEFGLQSGIAEVSYRSNLTDFPYAILSRGDVKDFGVFMDMVYHCLPRIIFPMKDLLETGVYDQILSGAGLHAGKDYTDTLFSAGAMAWGWAGYYLYPVVFVLMLYVVGKHFAKKSRWGVIALMLYYFTMLSAFYIELGPQEIIMILRNMTMYVFVFMIPFITLSRRQLS